MVLFTSLSARGALTHRLQPHTACNAAQHEPPMSLTYTSQILCTFLNTCGKIDAHVVKAKFVVKPDIYGYTLFKMFGKYHIYVGFA